MKEKNFEPLKHFIASNDWENEVTELHEVNINVSEKNGFYIYNYNNAVLVPRDDPIIKSCRGLVLDNNGHLSSLAFFRFFNAHETECDTIDWESAEILEKLDGSLISVWHTGKEWEVTTRGSFYPNEHAHNFKETFCRLFDDFEKLTPGFTYVFEMMSKDNRIVTRYDDEFVVLIGVRNLKNLLEVGQDELDVIAEAIDVKRPKRFNASSVIECKQLFKNLNDDEEGLVIVDKDFNRMKLKQESYLKMAKIISLKNQDVLEYVLGKIDLDADFTDMPELKEKENEVSIIYNEVKDYILDVFDNMGIMVTQKEFASHALNYKFSSVLFGLRAGKKYEDICIRWDKVVEYHSSMVVSTPNKLIVLRGIPGAGKSTWLRETNLEKYTLCADTIRLMYSVPNPYISQEHNAIVWKTLYSMLETRMKEGSFVIIDAVHQTNKSLKQYRKMCEEYDYDIEIRDFKISLEDALERNKNRELHKMVPEEVIEKMHNQLIQTFINEENKE